MAKTDVYCTRCGREFEEYEDVVVISSGFVESGLAFSDDFEVVLSDGPYLEALCSTCRKPKPNRVVVEGLVSDVRAERPDEIMVIARDPIMGLFDPVEDGTVFGLLDGLPIKQLNTVKEEL